MNLLPVYHKGGGSGSLQSGMYLPATWNDIFKDNILHRYVFKDPGCFIVYGGVQGTEESRRIGKCLPFSDTKKVCFIFT